MMNKIKLTAALFGLVLAISITASAQSAVYTTLEGEKLDLGTEEGKVVVLAVGASWLPLSVQQAALLNKLSKKYATRDVVFFFIAADSASIKSRNYASSDDIRKFADENELAATVLRDPDGAVSLKRFGVDQLPSFVILDKAGEISGEPFSGFDPRSDLAIPMSKIIDRLL